MHVFLSWSGERSKQIANLLKDWLPLVIQAVKPWVSTQDIQQGSKWDSEIGDSLEKSKVGIFCLTQENKEKPWILFEAGSLHKGLSANRVCTFLIDLEPTDLLENPLSSFNHTLNTKEGILKLLKTVNLALEENKLDDIVLTKVFEKNYNELVQDIEGVLTKTPHKQVNEKNLQNEMIKETLMNSREITVNFAKLTQIMKSVTEKISKNNISFSVENFKKEVMESINKQKEQEEYIKQKTQF